MNSFMNMIFSEVFLVLWLVSFPFIPEEVTSDLPSFTIVPSVELDALRLAYFSFLAFYFLSTLCATNGLTDSRLTQIPLFLALFPFLVCVLIINLCLPDTIENQGTLFALCIMSLVWGGWVMLQWLEDRYMPLGSYPLIGSLPSYVASFPRRHIYETDMIKTHGKTIPIRAGDQRGVWTADPKDVEYILKTNFENYQQGQGRKEIFIDLLGDGIFNVDGHRWMSQRKAASKEFSVSRFRDYMLEIFSEFSLEVLAILEEAVDKKTSVDLQDLFFRYTFDSFGKLAFGLDVGCLANEEAPAFANAFDRANILTSSRFFDPFWPLKKLLKMGNEGELAEHIKTIDDYVYKVIADRKKLSPADLESYHDFLSRFMRIKDDNGNPPSDKYLRDLITNFMIAGRDTTASGLSWTICHLIQHPEVVAKGREEIKAYSGKHPVEIPLRGQSDKSSGPILNRPSYDELKDMNYLHSIFSEALRMNPPVPTDGKTAKNNDTLPSGQKVRSGEIVAFMPFAMGRQGDLWEDPMKFDPERWLDKNGKFKRESPFKFSVFQAGPRQCLGVDFAYLEAKLILAMILQRYTLKLVDSPESLTEGVGLTMAIAQGLKVTVERI